MQPAQTWARTQLKNKYYDEFRDLYLKERKKRSTCGLPRYVQNRIYSKATCAAMTIIVSRYWEEYRKLYNQGIQNGLPHTHGWVKKADREGAND